MMQWTYSDVTMNHTKHRKPPSYRSYSPDQDPFFEMDPPFNNTPSRSPWQIGRSGYSSVSPSGSGSSGSSTNSQYYGSSPDELRADTLISSLLQIVNGENYVSRDVQFTPTRPSITRVGEPATTTSSEMTCLVPITKTTPAGCSTLYCNAHRDVQRLYCQTCSRPICADCGIIFHKSHVTVHLMDAFEIAGVQANQVLSEARVGICTLREDLESVQNAVDTLEQKTSQAITDVMTSIRKVAAALEARERELLNRIEKAKMMKYSALKARDEGLRHGISRLSKTVEKLSDIMECSSLCSNPLDLLITKDMASAEVFQVRQSHKNLPPPEENWISFTGPEDNVMHAIACLGNIVLHNPGPIGDRRSLRSRKLSISSSQALVPHALQLSLMPVPRGRAIASNSFAVTVKPPRTEPGTLINEIEVIGNDGEPADNLCRPWGVACDKEGHIIVADRSNNRIQIYHEDGTFVRRFGSHGVGPGQFDRPAGVAVDGRRRIIVADKDNHRIQILTMDGISLIRFGEKGSRCGQFNYPWDVAVNSECQIAVSDTRNHRVQLFSPEGVFLKKYGYENTPSMWKHFDSPRGVAFNPEGKVVTTDFNNHRVIVIDADFLNARIFGYETGGTKQFLRPQGLVIDDEGNVIIADSRNHRIQVFDSMGILKWRFGNHGTGTGEMDRPSGIALTAGGRIAVVDFGNNRLLVI